MNGIEKDKSFELTSFTVSASSSIVNSPDKGKEIKDVFTIQKSYDTQKRALQYKSNLDFQG